MELDPRHTTGIPTRERCEDCREISAVGFSVPDEVWEASVHPSLRHSILCLQCFARRADARLIPWEEEVELFPVSLVTHLRHNREQVDSILNPIEEMRNHTANELLDLAESVYDGLSEEEIEDVEETILGDR